MVESVFGISLDIQKILGTAGIIGLIILGLIIVSVILIVFWYITKHNKKVYLLYKTGDGVVLKENKGEKKIKEREFKLLYNRRILCQYPESRHLFQKGGKDAYIGYVENDVCTWLEVKKNGLVAADQNLMNFQVEEFTRIDEITKSKVNFWDKYGAQIALIMSMMIIMIIMILLFKEVGHMIDRAADVAAQANNLQMRAIQNQTMIL